MQYYDQHLHTYFSPDSSEKFENYLIQSDRHLVTTEHLDYFSSYQNRRDTIPHYEGYVKTIDQLNKQYNQRLLKGIEVGFTYPDRDRIKDFLSDKDFDIILLSIHHNGHHGFMTLNHDTKPLDDHLEEYFSLLLQGVQEMPNANVIAHFDFGLRGYDDVTIPELQQVEDKLTAIFELMIRQDQALELNTRSMYRYGNAHLYDYAIALYRSLGGELFTVSSDAHVARDYQLRFKDAFALLKDHNVEELVVYQKQEPIMVPLPNS